MLLGLGLALVWSFGNVMLQACLLPEVKLKEAGGKVWSVDGQTSDRRTKQPRCGGTQKNRRGGCGRVRSVQRGHLVVRPVMPVRAQAFRLRWALTLRVSSVCDEVCARAARWFSGGNRDRCDGPEGARRKRMYEYLGSTFSLEPWGDARLAFLAR